MSDAPVLTPPYLSFATFKTFIRHLKETPPIPDTIDRSDMTKVEGSVQQQLVGALRFFGLIEAKGNSPTPLLETAVGELDTDGWPQFVKGTLFPNYGRITSTIDLMKTTGDALKAAFGTEFSINGATRDKALRFFLVLLQEAGIPFSPHIKTPGASSPPRPRRRKASSGEPDVPKSDAPRADDVPSGFISHKLYFPNKPAGQLVVPANITEAEVQLVEMQVANLKAYAALRAQEVGS